MKVKITKELKEIEGEVVEKAVTPFGTSAHIPFAKQHTGKIVDVVVPKEPRYVWVLSRKDLNEVIKSCEKVLKSKPESKTTFLEKESIENIKDKTFSYSDLAKVLSILNKDKKNNKFVRKISDCYGFKNGEFE